MERGSDKHSARMDDALAHETEGLTRGGHDTHAEEWKSAEPSGEDQPQVSRGADGVLHGGVPDGLTGDDVDLRSEIAQQLGKEVWPATGAQLLAVASGREAPDRVLAALRQLPADRSFVNLQEAFAALSGGHGEAHRF